MGQRQSKAKGNVKGEQQEEARVKSRWVEAWNLEDVRATFPQLPAGVVERYGLTGDALCALRVAEDFELFDRPEDVPADLRALLLEHPQAHAEWIGTIMPPNQQTPQSMVASGDWEAHEIPGDAGALVQAYHEATFNTEKGGSRILKRIWMFQPKTVRRYVGAIVFPLPVSPPQPVSLNPTIGQLWRADEAALGGADKAAVSVTTLSWILFHSLALAARKAGSRIKEQPRSAWSKRCNASSGGLHPAELYLAVPQTLVGGEQELAPALYHYCPAYHSLERRRLLQPAAARDFVAQQPDAVPFLLSMATCREVWKYGERGLRYSELDAGHALGALVIAARLVGWEVVCCPGFAEADMEELWGLNTPRLPGDPSLPCEAEDPVVVGVLRPIGSTGSVVEAAASVRALLEAAEDRWIGMRNLLAETHAVWPIVQAVQTAMKSTGEEDYPPDALGVDVTPLELQQQPPALPWSQCLRSRRSALGFDPNKELTLQQFGALLGIFFPSVCPLASAGAFWPSVTAIPAVALFVLRVQGLQPGLYLLVRDPELEVAGLSWAPQRRHLLGEDSHIPALLEVSEQPVEGLGMPLYRLQGDPMPGGATLEGVSVLSSNASCRQLIAQHSSFTLGMLARVESQVEAHGAPAYRKMHWACGQLGQSMYVQATAMDLQTSGMGCFVDPMVNDWWQLPGLQTMYHMTVGVPPEVRDNRYIPFDYEHDMFACNPSTDCPCARN